MNRHKGWTLAWDMRTGGWSATKGNTTLTGYSDVLVLKRYIDNVEAQSLRKEETS